MPGGARACCTPGRVICRTDCGGRHGAKVGMAKWWTPARLACNSVASCTWWGRTGWPWFASCPAWQKIVAASRALTADGSSALVWPDRTSSMANQTASIRRCSGWRRVGGGCTAGSITAKAEERKAFFFGKKEAKNFCSAVAGLPEKCVWRVCDSGAHFGLLPQYTAQRAGCMPPYGPMWPGRQAATQPLTLTAALRSRRVVNTRRMGEVLFLVR